MNSKKLRNLAFNLHRYIGLFAGLILIIVGLTGSLLVFETEINQFLITQRFGQVIPQEKRLPLSTIVNTVTATYANHADWKLKQLEIPSNQEFYTIRLGRPDKTQWEVFVNPYTGKVMGDRQRETALFSRILNFHAALLSGKVGTTIVGIAAFILCLLSVTGVMLWNGWRNLIAGFKIKWNAHPKRLNYDLHKVAGIISVAFLSMTAFTGFCWNFSDQTTPIIYALTFTSKPAEAKSIVIPNQPSLNIDQLLQRSREALPDSVTTFIAFPESPEDSFYVFGKDPSSAEDFGDYVQLDQYTGKSLYVQNHETMGLGDRILNSFTPLHYGTFWGLPTRILYVFVGLTPLILFITGFTMWRLRYR